MKTLKKKKEQTYTYKEYCSWPEDERWELIDGEAFDMTPAPATKHQEISGNLFGILWVLFRGKQFKVFIAPFDVRLPSDGEEDEKVKTVVQPDLVVICDDKKIDDKGCRGAPDFVIEVLSPYTASKDHIRKKALYERHGVKEYWLVQPIDRIVTIYKLDSSGQFGKAEIFDSEAKISVSLFPGLEIDFKEVFPPETKIVRESPRKYLTGAYSK